MFTPRQSFLPYRSVLERGGADPFEGRLTRAGGPDRARGDYILYWAQASRRTTANLALDFAILQGNEAGLPVVVYESLRPDYPSANDRIHTFVLEGVEDNRRIAAQRGLRYEFFLPATHEAARGVLERLSRRARMVVTDEYPTFIQQSQTASFSRSCPVPLWLVDGNGILPMRAFPGEQYSARFFRDKAHREFEQRWATIPEIEPGVRPFNGDLELDVWNGTDISMAVGSCAIDHTVPRAPVKGGRAEALRRLEIFVHSRLEGYASRRNREPEKTSELSPYLHFGHVGIDEVARRVLFSAAPAEDIDAFLEEAVIRRELSFNLCHFRPDHDSLAVLPAWAARTLDAHRHDRRMPIYDFGQMERAETGDEVWNLAQRALLETGIMHNYLRMLWGKRVLEWTRSPEEAHRTMIALHERWALDGRDPNTHAGVLWCFGKHDRPWAPERPIFGMVRYMSSDATRKKVDLRGYRKKIDRETNGDPSLSRR